MLLKYTQGKIVIKTFLFSFPVLATLWNGIGLFWHLSLLFEKIIITFVALISRYITVPLIIIKVSVKRPTKLQRLATIQGLYDDRSGILFLYDRAQKRIEEKRKILSLRMKKKIFVISIIYSHVSLPFLLHMQINIWYILRFLITFNFENTQE